MARGGTRIRTGDLRIMSPAWYCSTIPLCTWRSRGSPCRAGLLKIPWRLLPIVVSVAGRYNPCLCRGEVM